MAFLSNILGLDVGSHSLKAVEFRQTLRGFEAVAMRTLPRANSDVSLPELIQHFIRMHRLSTDHAVCALAGDRLSTRRLNFPFRDQKRLSQVVPFEVANDTLFDLDDVLVDWEMVGGDRTHAEVVATVATRADVAELLGTLREAQSEPRTVEAEGLVLCHLSNLFDLAGTRLLIDLGHRKTTCCLIADGQPVASRTFPIAGAALTEALGRDRALNSDDAERAKCEGGVFGAGVTETLPATRATLDRIAREIIRTLGSLETQIATLESGPVRELTIFGGTAQLDRLDEYLAATIGVSTQKLGAPTQDYGKALATDTDAIVFAPAIALAMRGTAQAKTRMDFRQDEFAVRLDLSRYRRDLSWPLGLAAAAVILGLVNIATSTALESRRASQMEEQIEQLYTEVFPGQALPGNPPAALRQEITSATSRAEFLGVYRGNLSALDLLTEISKLVPKDLDVVFDELSIDRQIIRMRVYSKSFESADRLGAELAKFPPFAQARIGSIESDPKRGGKRFDVTISLAPPEGSV